MGTPGSPGLPPVRRPFIGSQFRLRTMLIVVAMTAISMFAVRMSVPEDGTFRGFIPFVCFALVGIWAARLRGRNLIVGGVAGGIVGAIVEVITQYVYYHYYYPHTRYASFNYIGVEVCLLIDSTAGSIVGLLLGSVAWVVFSIRTQAPRD